jgi:probable rRNA maturation factor
MINLQVKRKIKLPVQKSILLQAAQLTLDLENITSESSLSVVIGDDLLLKKLNLQYRGINTTTDVLSFPSSERDPDTNLLYLGDVVISLPRAELQASIGRHPLEEELQLLVVHGTLHLLGYDHLIGTDKKKMQAAQERVLNQLGVQLVVRL